MKSDNDAYSVYAGLRSALRSDSSFTSPATYFMTPEQSSSIQSQPAHCRDALAAA
jgi:hypothetical protein